MKLWGGRFSGEIDEHANAFHSSIGFDKKLYKHDIKGSIAYAQMLGKQGIISNEDAKAIIKSLEQILEDIEKGVLKIDETAEDIHTFVEAELISRIGEAGKRLHTGRSRNDQVALDMRMYVKEEIDNLCSQLVQLLRAFLDTAKSHTSTIMPGFTHLQKAQPITLAHHVLAYFQMFKRDYLRLQDCRKRTDEMPLGSGALASTSYPLDREFLREKLGFAVITENSLDAVSDRDFCIEFISCMSMIMMHLSRFCEELIIWSTDAFNFISISDAYATGSSIMPQKKNPDMAELIKGKTGRVYGSLIGILSMMKSLPLAYNKDMQEDKEAVFDSAGTVRASLQVFCGMFESLQYNIENMKNSALGGYTNATDAADWLVKKGLAFREAHEVSGRLVLLAIEKKVRLEELSLEEIKKVSQIFDDTFYDAISIERCVEVRSLEGGPSKGALEKAIKNAEVFLSKLSQ
ncbi:MAG: argininosuccinate lyase [Treponema sp.]|nr:argininosuccinate lyase [Treponema sp.]